MASTLYRQLPVSGAVLLVLMSGCDTTPSTERADEPRFSATAVQVWTAGGPDEEDGLVLVAGPSSGSLRSDGLAAVVDRLGARVFLVGPDGALRTTIGARGQGPGEYMQPRQVGFSGDSLLWVSDPPLGRMTWFDSAGRVVDTWSAGRRDIPGTPWSAQGNWVVGGSTILGLPALDPMAPEDPPPPVPVALVPDAGDPRVLEWIESPEPGGLVLRTDAGQVAGSRPQPIAAAPIIDVATGGAWFFVVDRAPRKGPRHTIEIRRYDPSGASLGDATIAYQPTPMDAETIAALRADIQVSVEAAQRAIASFPPSFGRLTVDGVMESLWIPDHLPPVRDALADDGGFWLLRERATYRRGSRPDDVWERYDLEGRLQAKVLLPSGFQALAGLPNRLFGFNRTAGGAPELVSYDIEFHALDES